jgi:hypothetical protein
LANPDNSAAYSLTRILEHNKRMKELAGSDSVLVFANLCSLFLKNIPVCFLRNAACAPAKEAAAGCK